MKKEILIAAIMITVIPSFVYAYCSEPAEPQNSVPTPPFCTQPYGGVFDCDQWEVEKFNNEIQSYINEWQEYVNNVIEFANCIQEEATHYQQEAINVWNGFAARMQ